MCLHKRHFFTIPLPSRKGPGGWCGPALRSVQVGESSGEHPLWQAVWRMCLHTLLFSTFPPSWKEGGQGDGAVPHYGAYKRGVQRGAPPLAGGLEDVPPYTTLLYYPLPGRKGARGMVRSRTTVRASGESRGEHPHWQAVWRMCLHKRHFFTIPLPGRKGARGMVRSRTTERTSGESRGEHPHWQATWDTKIQ